ncbi:hypothetical protein L218DRAFT_973747 [Marasmius fiardii PR-910]|nr:hypothetical protein L218DRAFT_973747 [Marasmius fiardii PR-910]
MSTNLFRYLSLDQWALEPLSPSQLTTTLGPAGWSNGDMDPVPNNQRVWTIKSYIVYWISATIAIPNWIMAGSMLVKQALLAISVTNMIISCVMMLNGIVGARLYAPFPVLARCSFGFWLSYLPVMCRVIAVMICFKTEPHTFLPDDNRHSPSQEMMCYALYWLIQFPLMLVPPHRLTYLLSVFICVSIHTNSVSIIIVLPSPIVFLGMIIWAMTRAPPNVSLAANGNLHGKTCSLGAYTSLSMGISDFTVRRFATYSMTQNTFVQLFVLPIGVVFSAFAGIAVTSAGQVLYNETLWDPFRFIDRAWSENNRPVAFLTSFAFVLATLVLNVGADSLGVANDLMVLCPKYVNIRRGQIICELLGGKPKGFIAFTSSITIFIAPFTGMWYWIVHRCKVDVNALHDPQGRYRYWNGINWRAVVALLFSVPPSVPGLVAKIDPALGQRLDPVKHIFSIARFYGFFTSMAVYLKVFPAAETCCSGESGSVARAAALTSDVKDQTR